DQDKSAQQEAEDPAAKAGLAKSPEVDKLMARHKEIAAKALKASPELKEKLKLGLSQVLMQGRKEEFQAAHLILDKLEELLGKDGGAAKPETSESSESSSEEGQSPPDAERYASRIKSLTPLIEKAKALPTEGGKAVATGAAGAEKLANGKK